MGTKYLIVSQIYDNNKDLCGYRAIEVSTQANSGIARNIHLKAIQIAYQQARNEDIFVNAKFDNNGNLVGTQGRLADYPIIDINGKVLSKHGYTVATLLTSDKTNDVLGAVVFDACGIQSNLKTKDLQSISKHIIQANYTLGLVNGVLQPISKGTPFTSQVLKLEKNIVMTKGSSGFADKKSCFNGYGPDKTPGFVAQAFSKIKGLQTYQNADTKMYKAKKNLLEVAPYYYSMLETIEIIPVHGFGTLGVTENKMIYDIDFVSSISIAELTFILIHEMNHIALKHPTRGLNKENHTLWNIATDLYINSTIEEEFGCYWGKPEVSVDKGVIKAPNFGVFQAMFGKSIDSKIDSAETIYRALMKENPNGAQFNNAQTASPSQQANSQGSQSQGNSQGSQSQGNSQGSQSQGNSQGSSQGSSSGQSGQSNSNSHGSQGQSGQSNSNSSLSQGQSGQNSSGQGSMSTVDGKQVIDKLQAESSANSTQSQSARAYKSCGSQSAKSAQAQVSQGTQEVLDGLNNNNRSQIQSGLNKMRSGLDAMQDAQNEAQSQGNPNAKNMQSAINRANNSMSLLEDSVGMKGQSQGSQGQQQSTQSQGKQNQSQGSQNQNQGNQGQQHSNQEQSDPFANSDSQNVGEGKTSFGDDGFDNSKQMQDVTVVFNGKKVTTKIPVDVMSNHAGKELTKDVLTESREEATRQATDIRVKRQLDSTKIAVGSKAWGYGKSCQREIEFEQAVNFDWTAIIKKICTPTKKSTYSVGQPNKLLMSGGTTAAGKVPMRKKGNNISHIKVCVDISGSIDDVTLNYYLSIIAGIFKRYKVSGELIYWADGVSNVGEFSSIKDITKIETGCSGGTDVLPVFQYLAGESKFEGKKEKDKPREISLIIIITDGYFDSNYSKYEKFFGKKTVWLCTQDDAKHLYNTKCFGRVAVMSSNI